jgi:hypothetical protein
LENIWLHAPPCTVFSCPWKSDHHTTRQMFYVFQQCIFSVNSPWITDYQIIVASPQFNSNKTPCSGEAALFSSNWLIMQVGPTNLLALDGCYCACWLIAKSP